MDPVYLALGSNLGNRKEFLQAGVQGLVAHGIDIIQCASIYSTEPLEIREQPWFLNTVLQATTVFEPAQLMQACLEVEKENQRTRQIAKGPRTLDIDIVFYGSRIIHETGLTIPHPSFSSRRFVLTPLAEIAPDFTDPLSGKTIRQLLEICPDASSVNWIGKLL
jgi:2-amino-4-hydroxy-6-hydroxymethyldihydropteridine diphosphokinase